MSDSAIPWTAAHRASLSFTISQNCLKLMSIESVMPSNPLVYMSENFMPIPHYLDYYSFVVSVESRIMSLLFFSPFSRLFWLFGGPVRFHMTFKNGLFHFCKKWYWGFDSDSIDSIGCLRWHWHCNNIQSFSLWTWDVFPFTYVFLNSSHFVTFIIPSFSLDNWTSKYFILLGTVINEIVFLISFLFTVSV